MALLTNYGPALFAIAEALDGLRAEIAKATKHLHEWGERDTNIGDFAVPIDRCIHCGDRR